MVLILFMHAYNTRWTGGSSLPRLSWSAVMCLHMNKANQTKNTTALFIKTLTCCGRLQYVRQHSFLTNEWQYILYADQWAWHEHMCSLSETLQLRSFITLSIINTKKQPLSNVLVIFCPAIYLIISSPCIHVEKKPVYFESRHSCNLQLDYRLKVVTQLIVMFAT